MGDRPLRLQCVPEPLPDAERLVRSQPRLGQTERPLPIHEYKYKDDPAAVSHVGPMAQDVEKVDRGAVKTIKGTKFIDMTRMGSILRDKKEARRHG